jgi:hypothetical protein
MGMDSVAYVMSQKIRATLATIPITRADWFTCVLCNSLDGRRPANLQTALVTWYASASE